jgi:osmotically-inducible protein OsmY
MTHFFDKTNSELKQDVINKLMTDLSVNSKHISVEADNGIITLYGTVPHYFQKETATTAAQQVQGVLAVADEMEVSLSDRKSDQQIAKAVLKAFRWNLSVPLQIKIKVEKGWVTLTGAADWDFQRIATQNTVSRVNGVCGITNNIQLKSSINPNGIRGDIEACLRRSTVDKSARILVFTEEGRVILTGTCSSMTDLNDATMAAWMVPGVTHVKNLIRII